MHTVSPRLHTAITRLRPMPWPAPMRAVHPARRRVSIPEGLQCVLFIPDDEMPTTEARAVLPAKIDRDDAIFNIARAAMLINCFATSQFDPMRMAMEDRLHQQYRKHM